MNVSCLEYNNGHEGKQSKRLMDILIFHKEFRNRSFFRVAHPFSLNENVDLGLIMDKGRVIVYNSVNNNTRDVFDFEQILSIGAITYVEILISP